MNAFWGGTEHRQFCYTMIQHGTFPDNYKEYPGMKWSAIEGMTFKGGRFGTTRGKVEDMTGLHKFSHLSNDGKTCDVKNDIGGMLFQWTQKLGLNA